MVTQASTTAEREAALAAGGRAVGGADDSTLGADKSYQHEEFVAGLRGRGIGSARGRVRAEPEVAQLADASRSASSEGFAISQRKRKLVEKVFGWAKQDRSARQVKLRGRARVDWLFQHGRRRAQPAAHAKADSGAVSHGADVSPEAEIGASERQNNRRTTTSSQLKNQRALRNSSEK